MEGSFDSFQQTYLRILLAGIMALIVFRNQLGKRLFSSLSNQEWAIYSTRAVISYVVGVAAFSVAIQHANLCVVSFISTLPVLGILAFILFREKVPFASILFVALSAVGVFILIGVDVRSFHIGIGEVASLIALIGFNAGFLMSRLHDKKRNNFENTTILLLIGWIPVFIISMGLKESVIPHDMSAAAIIGLLLSAVLNVVGLYAINYVFTNLRAYVAGNILLLESIWATIIGAIWYGESITTAIAIGGALIIISALMVNHIESKNNEAPVAVIDTPGQTADRT